MTSYSFLSQKNVVIDKIQKQDQRLFGQQFVKDEDKIPTRKSQMELPFT